MHPDEWAWAPWPAPRGRFDPRSGRFRVRYAASRPAVAARERFAGRVLTPPDGSLWLIRLEAMPPALHLTWQSNLDRLGLDDRVSTGRLDSDRTQGADSLLDTCGRLADAVYDWWDGRPPPLVYRARTVPSGRSLGFASTVAVRATSVRPLREATALHVHLVLVAGFSVPDQWLGSDVGVEEDDPVATGDLGSESWIE